MSSLIEIDHNDLNIFDRVRELPPSVKLVFKTLERNGTMTLSEIERETYLPYRTVRYAINRLKAEGIILKIFYIKDARKSLYRLAG
ncbi:MAG TPA: helix-turn-helix domain-containing protein [Candidatus Acidoferrales bacterium]|nr:helix-turn-helix domain-containing protein [Candidatus Acidoferrales bacterium]